MGEGVARRRLRSRRPNADRYTHFTRYYTPKAERKHVGVVSHSALDERATLAEGSRGVGRLTCRGVFGEALDPATGLPSVAFSATFCRVCTLSSAPHSHHTLRICRPHRVHTISSPLFFAEAFCRLNGTLCSGGQRGQTATPFGGGVGGVSPSQTTVGYNVMKYHSGEQCTRMRDTGGGGGSRTKGVLGKGWCNVNGFKILFFCPFFFFCPFGRCRRPHCDDLTVRKEKVVFPYIFSSGNTYITLIAPWCVYLSLVCEVLVAKN